MLVLAFCSCGRSTVDSVCSVTNCKIIIHIALFPVCVCVCVCVRARVYVLHLEQRAVNLDIEPQFLATLSFKLLDSKSLSLSLSISLLLAPLFELKLSCFY